MTSSVAQRWSFRIATLVCGASVIWGAGRVLLVGRMTELDQGVRALRCDKDRLLVNVDARWLVVNAREKSVVSASIPPTIGERFGVALILRDRLVGVPLGDGVKGYDGEGWSFQASGVVISLVHPSVRQIRVAMPNGKKSTVAVPVQ